MTQSPPPVFNIAEYCLGASPIREPGKVALIVVHDADAPDGAEQWTYAQLSDAVRRMASGIQAAGLPRGARVLIRMGNTADYALLYFAILAAGYIAVPTSAQLTEREAQFALKDSGAAVMAVGEGLSLAEEPGGVQKWGPAEIAALRAHEPLKAFAETGANDPAFLIYTSGTSGEPKGVLHAHRSAWGRRPMYVGWYGLTGDDRLLHAGAFNWTYTLGVGLTDPWANGATTIVYNGEKVVSVWLRLIERFGATIIAGVPTLYRQILKHCTMNEFDLSTLRHGLTAGEPLPLVVAEEWQSATGTPLYEALGMSECSTYISSSPSVPVRPGSPGKPQMGRRVAILPIEDGTEPLSFGEVGLLAVHRSDPGLMLGYWQRPEEDAAVTRGDWFVGGDLARMDDDGYVWFEGRNDDVMTSMGYRVSPAEVEAALTSHPHVAEVAVTETTADSGVRLISAFIVGESGEPDLAAIEAWAADGLAPYKRPRRYFVVNSLPRTANGKLQRSALRAPLSASDK